MLKAMKALITGAAGAVGCYLARDLLARDYELTLVDNLQRGRRDAEFEAILNDARVTFLELDLTDPSSYASLGGGYDYVYHLAAVNGTRLFYEIPEVVLRTNTLSLIYLLDWFKEYNRASKFCFTSSNEAYASALDAFGVLPFPTPENVPLVIADPYNPRWSYASTKLIGELFVIHYAQRYNLKAIIVRPHNFYGPRSGYDHVIPDFCGRVNASVDPFPIYGSDESRSFCYLEDAVEAMRLLMESSVGDKAPETVHIGSQREITMGELADLLFKVAGWRPATIQHSKSPPGSVKRRQPDIQKIKLLVGWEPRTSLEDGLRRTLDWYRKNPKGT